MKFLAKLRIEPFMLGILASVAIAAALPVRGQAASAFSDLVDVAIGLLFFLYGTRLSPREAMDGLRHWRLHATVLTATFILFPLIGLLLRVLVPSVLSSNLYTGVLYLCLLPSTVQSSIAFTSIARGNVAGAVVSASMSNLLGIFVTPALVMLLMHANGHVHVSADSILKIVIQLLVPFLAGQLLRPWTGWLTRHTTITKTVDRGSIYLVVYSAFSAGMVEHIWSGISPWSLVAVVVVNIVVLAVVLTTTTLAGKALGFSWQDRIVITFCGSKKSLATGLPMASVLFAGQPIGLIVLPLLLFHQIQLFTCAWLAQRWARLDHPPTEPQVRAASAS